MEGMGQPNIRPGSRTLPILAGVVIGCLGVCFMLACLLGSGVLWLARADLDARRAGPPLSADDPLASGRQIFQARCAPCHSTGTDQRAGPGLAGLFAPGGPQLPAGVDYAGKLPNGQEITDANVAAWIEQGGRGQIGYMPGQSLRAAQMQALLAYLKTLEK